MQRLLADKSNLETFLNHCHRRRYPKKTSIVSPGDPADTLYFILEGSVVISLEDDDDNELILAYLNEGEFLGELGLFIEQPARDVSIKTRTECLLAEINYQRVHQLLSGSDGPIYMGVLFALGTQLSERLLRTSRQAGRLAFHDVTGRIARTLLDLCEQPDAMTHPDGMQIRITRQEISRIVGCSREMAGRILKSLEQQGLVSVKGKTIVVYGAR